MIGKCTHATVRFAGFRNRSGGLTRTNGCQINLGLNHGVLGIEHPWDHGHHDDHGDEHGEEHGEEEH